MIAIVPAILIVYVVDAIKYAAKVSVRITFVDKAMLCPVAHHHNKSCIDHGYDENHECCFEINKAHQDTEDLKHGFTKSEPQVDFFPLVMKEIHKRIDDADQ